MLDVPELEKRWSKYHFKKMLPRYVGAAVFISVLAGVSGYFYLATDILQSSVDKTITLSTKKPSVTTKVVQTKTVTSKREVATVTKKIDIPQNILQPSFVFTSIVKGEILSAQLEQERLERQTQAAQSARELALKRREAAQRKKEALKRRKAKILAAKRHAAKKSAATKPIAPKKEITKVVVLDAHNTAVLKQAQEEVKVGHVQTSDDELKGVIKRFNRKKKPALSLFIANKYYGKGDYTQSYKYARETLKLNPKIEDGVILYAKSLVKLGRKDKAVNKLNSYYKKSRSIKAKALLTEIKKGTFK